MRCSPQRFCEQLTGVNKPLEALDSVNLHQTAFWTWPVQCSNITRLNAMSYGWLDGDGPVPVGYSDQEVDLEVLDSDDIICWPDAPLFVTADDGEDLE